MVYVGVSGRFLVEVEALNMAESVGNVVRHKKAPIVVPVLDENGEVKGYALRYLPVVSGMSIAHGYQELLVRVAQEKGLPVCPLCRQGVFVKHGADEILKRLEQMGATYVSELKKILKKKEGNVVEEFERTVVENCLVEDVGGFLYPGAQPVKRTSCFYAGYMIPSLAHAHAVAVEALFHVRHDPITSGGRAGRETGQAIYHVEAGSALYTLSLGLDLDCVGCVAGKEVEKARERREAALVAMGLLVDGFLFGAKRTRFQPSVEPESLVLVVSHPFPFNPLPGHGDDYIVETVKRAANYVKLASKAAGNAFIHVYYYAGRKAAKPGAGVQGVVVEEVSSPAEAFEKALAHVDKASCRG